MPSLRIWELRSNARKADRSQILSSIMGASFKDVLNVRSIVGLTSIRVCYNPHGNAISAIDTRRSRNFPCNCINRPNSGMAFYDEQRQFNDVVGVTEHVERFEEYCGEKNFCNPQGYQGDMVFYKCNNMHNHKIV